MICELLPTVNIRKILVTPVVGLVDATFEPIVNDEVSQVFRLPLHRFLSTRGHSTFRFSTSGTLVHFFEDTIEGVIIYFLYMSKKHSQYYVGQFSNVFDCWI